MQLRTNNGSIFFFCFMHCIVDNCEEGLPGPTMAVATGFDCAIPPTPAIAIPKLDKIDKQCKHTARTKRIKLLKSIRS